MTIFDNAQHLEAVAGEWGHTPQGFAIAITLIRLAVEADVHGPERIVEWIIASGYATPLPDGFRITDAGRARARSEA